MSLKFGLQYGDDEPDPKTFEKTSFEANRKKTNFENDMDSLLFGNAPPPSRRKRKEQPGSQEKKPGENQTKPSVPTKPEPQEKKPAENQTKSSLPINSNKGIQKNTANSLLNKSKQSEKSNANKSTGSISEKPKTQIDNYINKKPEPKQPEPPKKDVGKKNTPSILIEQPSSEIFQQPPSIIIQQPKNIRQTDTDECIYEIKVSSLNRPTYIRKLKKIAQNFNFHNQNIENHSTFEVVRPRECLREIIKKQNYFGFEDRQFPPDSYSIGPKYRAELVIFKKPSQIYKSPVFGKYIDPNDIEPGSLSSPQFVSILSCLAEREENIKRLIENQKVSPSGFYYVRLNINGVWRYISVDDNLPELDDKPIGVRSFNDSEADIWSSIIEKAYAKAYQGYISFSQNVPRQHYLRDLTGAPVKKYEIKNSNLAWVIGDALEKGFPVLAVPKQKIVDIGLNPNFSLSVLKCNSTGGLQLRSSFGTISERPKIPISKEGVFELSSSYAAEYISHVLIAQTDKSLRTTTIQAKHHGSFYSCFNFKVSEETYGTISVSQFDKRLFSKKSNYDYVPFRIILEMKNASDQGESVFINAAFSHHSRNLDLAVNLAKGSYYLYCIGQWEDKYYDYDITVTAKQCVKIKRVWHQNFPNIIAEALTEQTLKKGKRSAKGHVDEYILYHEPSNLVLITAKSLVDKPYTFTLNLSQVKFDTLTLLNVAKPEDNFSRKNRQQIEDLKSSYFLTKTWEANLLAEEKYTWVFSSSLDYNESNLKAWGFR